MGAGGQIDGLLPDAVAIGIRHRSTISTPGIERAVDIRDMPRCILLIQVH